MMKDELLVKRDYLKEIAALSQTYTIGDTSEEVLKIKEWLLLWQLNENYVDIMINLDTVFDSKTASLVKEIQKFMGLAPTGIVDAITWSSLVDPLRKAFSINAYNQSTLQQKVKFFATKHVAFRASELQTNNIGPWVRSYMGGSDGTWEYWCQGFVCTILDQAWSSMGKRFDQYYPNTFLCEAMRKHARAHHLLITNQQLRDGLYIPQEGDIVLYIEKNSQKAHHTEVIYDILDKKEGFMRTIGGNTNFVGSSNGVGTFFVDRNYLTNDVEVVKLIRI